MALFVFSDNDEPHRPHRVNCSLVTFANGSSFGTGRGSQLFPFEVVALGFRKLCVAS